ncbi:MAG TPA: ATP-binding protein [Kribbella sp.]|nr:ATP-binding protein [Kribbella sp.]
MSAAAADLSARKFSASRARRARLWTGLGLVVAGLPALTAALVRLRGHVALESVLLLYLLVVVLVAVAGGIVPGVVAALAAVLLVNYFFTMPYHTLVVDQRDSIIALVVFVLVAVTVSVTVEVAMRHRVAATRSRTEAEVLSRFTAEPVTDTSLAAVLEQVRDTFGMVSVALLERHGDNERVAATAGRPLRGHPVISVPAGDGLRLVAEGPELFAEDRKLLTRLAGAAARAWEGKQLAGEAAQARQLAEVDRLRSALLAAVGHDLRTPLSAIKAAVSSLRQRDVSWSPAERAELLATIEESADRLDDLIANLLAMSRLQAGALSVSTRPVVLDEVVANALIGVPAADVTLEVPDDLPLVLADPGLLERVIANLVDNARRFSPVGAPVHIEAEYGDAMVRLSVVDSGPGVPAEDWEHIFTPFQRLDDHRSDGGFGLGLAIARGFSEAMDCKLIPSQTLGGGLTMTVTLPVMP